MLSLAADLKDSSRAKRAFGQADEFVVSPTSYFVYQGYKDRYFLEVYSAAYPDINDVHVEGTQEPPHREQGFKNDEEEEEREGGQGGEVDPTALVLDDMEGLSPEEMLRRMAQKQRRSRRRRTRRTRRRPRRRRRSCWSSRSSSKRLSRWPSSPRTSEHSICKLFCGVIGGLSKYPRQRAAREWFVLRLAGGPEDQHTAALKTSLQSREHFVRVGNCCSNRR